jgi:hypothetical protein
MSAVICVEGDIYNDQHPTYGQVSAGAESPGPEWLELASFRVFTGPYPGTVPIRNCRATDWNSGTYEYVSVGDFCSTPDDHLTSEDLGVVGYLSDVAAPGYQRLQQIVLRYAYYYSDGYVPIASVPVINCPSSCTCTTSSAFVIP